MPMADVTNEDLQKLLIETMASTKTMHEATARQMDSDRKNNMEALSNVNAGVRAVTQGLTNLEAKFEQRISSAESRASSAETTARGAMQSHHDLDTGLRAELSDVKALLQDQNAVRDATVIAKAAEKEREAKEKEKESIAAKRLNEKSIRRTDFIKAIGPTLAVVITVTGSVAGTYFATQKFHEDSAAKQDAANLKLLTIEKKVDTAIPPPSRISFDPSTIGLSAGHPSLVMSLPNAASSPPQPAATSSAVKSAK